MRLSFSKIYSERGYFPRIPLIVLFISIYNHDTYVALISAVTIFASIFTTRICHNSHRCHNICDTYSLFRSLMSQSRVGLSITAMYIGDLCEIKDSHHDPHFDRHPTPPHCPVIQVTPSPNTFTPLQLTPCTPPTHPTTQIGFCPPYVIFYSRHCCYYVIL